MRRWLIIVGAIVAAVLVATVGFRGLDRETPEKAIYSLAHDLEHGDVDGVCERTVPSASLPPAATRALRHPARPGTSRGPGCHLDTAALAQIELHEPRVHRVDEHAVRPQRGVDGAATARVQDGSRTWSLPLVRLDGRWRVVLDAAESRLSAGSGR